MTEKEGLASALWTELVNTDNTRIAGQTSRRPAANAECDCHRVIHPTIYPPSRTLCPILPLLPAGLAKSPSRDQGGGATPQEMSGGRAVACPVRSRQSSFIETYQSVKSPFFDERSIVQ